MTMCTTLQIKSCYYGKLVFKINPHEESDFYETKQLVLLIRERTDDRELTVV